MTVAIVVGVTLNRYPCPKRGREFNLGLPFGLSVEIIEGFFEKHSEQ
jgi:hypothetical protein